MRKDLRSSDVVGWKSLFRTGQIGTLFGCSLLMAATHAPPALADTQRVGAIGNSPNGSPSEGDHYSVVFELDPVAIDALDSQVGEATYLEGSCTPAFQLCSYYEDCESERLCRCFGATPDGFDSFISPMTNPVFFEDPRTLTEARFIFLHHQVPFAAGGGDIQLYALQIRAAITERLSLIATKDGYAVSSNPLIQDGWADVAAGLKYNLYANRCDQQLLSAGVVYELPVGSRRTLQGNGDGEFHVFLSGGTQLCCRGHWISGTGFRLPVDGDAESHSWYWSNHFDYQVSDRWYVLTEVNWYHLLGSGTNGLPGVEGGDLFNLGSTGVSGNDIVTGAFGVKFKPSRLSEIGTAFEFPLTDRRDVLESRLTVDLIRRF